MEDSSPAPAAVDAPAPAARRWKSGLIQLATITAGVLIALLFDGLVGWNRDRTLVREARGTIARELAANKKEVDGKLSELPESVKRFDIALRMANQLLQTGKTDVNKIDLGLPLAELQAVSWRSAERTGALALMDFVEVQAYSRVYDFQDLYVEQQRRSVEKLSAAIALLGAGDPHRAPAADLELFRRQVLALRGDLLVEERVLKRLSELYQRTLDERAGTQDGRTDSPTG